MMGMDNKDLILTRSTYTEYSKLMLHFLCFLELLMILKKETSFTLKTLYGVYLYDPHSLSLWLSLAYNL